MNDWTGYLGGHPEAQTPNIDRLANKGTAFTRAYTAAPGCSPSRNALLYGIEPFHSGLYPFYEHDIHEQLMSKYTSLPRLLKNNGYTTLGLEKFIMATWKILESGILFLKPLSIKNNLCLMQDFREEVALNTPTDQLRMQIMNMWIIR